MFKISKTKQDALLKTFKGDYSSAKPLRDKLQERIIRWKKERNAEPYGNENKDRSQIVSRDIKKHEEWQHSAIVEPFVSTPDIIKATPATYEDSLISPKIEILLNTFFCRLFNRYTFINKVVRVLSQEGYCVVRLGWEYEEKRIVERVLQQVPNPQLQQGIAIMEQLQAAGDMEGLQQLEQQLQSIPPTIEVPTEVTNMKPVKNNPTAVLCRNEDVFIDPTCKNSLDNCQFIIHRYESDYTTLKSAGVYSNLDEISLDDSEDSDYTRDDEDFKFSDNPRKKVVVYEYWGNYDLNEDGIAEPIVCTWVKDVIIQLDTNPFPDKKLPFIVCPYSVEPHSLYGESNAELLSDTQKVKTAILRGFIDNMALSNNAQKGIRKGALDSYNLKRYLSGQNFEFNGTPNDFYDGHFNELPGSAFNMLQLLNNEAESITGIATFNTGINGNSLGSTATQVRGAVDSATTRRLNIVRNISENLIKPLLRKWLAYASEFLDEESQFRITNDEFVWIKRDDLGANIDIDLNISTSDDNQAKASELAFMLQTIGPHEDPNIRKMLMIQIARLYRMPDLAKELEEYQPQPDPMQQQMQQLQIQLLQAQIEDLRAKTMENSVDVELKGAKTDTERAKAQNLLSQAKNIDSNTDNLDLDYLHKYYGTKHKQELEKQNQKNQYDIDRELLKLIEKTNKGYL